jgi:hypothetical protein
MAYFKLKVSAIAIDEIISILLLILLVLITALYFLQKVRFFELCENYCAENNGRADTGNFGLDCNCWREAKSFKENSNCLFWGESG